MPKSTKPTIRAASAVRRAAAAARPKPLAELLENRQLMTAGGGFVDSGLSGAYFANPDLSGAPSFVRQDVRIDFDWGATAPGGSSAAPYAGVPADGFSARWTGQFVPAFAEAYTFHTTADDGVRLSYRPAGDATWRPLVDAWDAGPVAAERSGTTAVLVAGAAYDVKLEHRELAGDATMKLHWSGASTPRGVVEPVRQIQLGLSGINDSTVDKPFADIWKTLRGYEAPNGGTAAPALDAQRWPTADFKVILWDGNYLTGDQSGTYRLSFDGRATVTGTVAGSPVNFTGYDPATNRSTYEFVLNYKGNVTPILNFADTRRTAAGATNTGIANIRMMRPGHGDDSTFTQPAKDLAAKYSALRFMDWTATNHNQAVNWADRTKPNENQVQKFGGFGRGVAWEHVVQFANETGKDVWINVPAKATSAGPDAYVQKLADLLKNGSTVGGVYYPGLNANLRAYVEYSNEVWNTTFTQFSENLNAAVAEAAAGPGPLNYDGTSDKYLLARRRVADQAKRVGEIFKGAFGAGDADRIRPVYAWQYSNTNNTASDGLEFLNDYYNNGDGITHVASPKPVNHWLWGGGGASYFTTGNETGAQTAVAFNDPSFELGGAWAFTGDAGLTANGGALRNPAAPSGTRAAYIAGNGSARQSIDFPAGGTYGLTFRASRATGQAGGNGVRVLVDGVQVGNAVTPSFSTKTDAGAYASYASLDFTVPAGRHEIAFVGTSGDPAMLVFVDDVKVQGEDAIFAAGAPSNGFYGQMVAQANWAAAYGLKYVAYEGGWSLVDNGGNGYTTSGVQSAAREDDRARQATVTAMDQFAKAGGVLFADFGSGGRRSHPWARTNVIENLDTALLRGVDQASGTIAPAPTNAVAPGTYAAGAAHLRHKATNGAGPVTLSTKGWVSFNVYVAQGGRHNLAIDAADGGTLQVLVDGREVDAFASRDALTRPSTNVALSRGLHTVRVRAAAGAFVVSGVSVTPGAAARPGPALAAFELAGHLPTSAPAAVDSSAAGVTVSALTRGAGLVATTNATYRDGFVSDAAGYAWAADLAGAIAKNQYAAFTIAPRAGETMSLARLRLQTFAQGATAGLGVAVRYSTDGGTTFVTAPSAGGHPAFDIDLAGIPTVQNASTPVTFRVYFYGLAKYQVAGLGRASGNDVVVLGTTSATGTGPVDPVDPVDPIPTNAPPTFAPAGGSVTTADTTASLSVLGADDAGEGALTYAWAPAATNPAGVTFSANGVNDAKSTVVSFTSAGAYKFTVTATDAGGLSATRTVDVTVTPTVTAITVTPAAGGPVAAGGVRQFGATALDQFGDRTNAAFAWAATGGTVDAGGLFTASATPGAFTVTATGGGVTGMAAGTIVAPAAPANAAPSVSAVARLVGRTSAALSATGVDDGGASNLTFAWSALPGGPAPVAFSANGTTAARASVASFARAGTYRLVVTATDAGGLTATGRVDVTVAASLTGLAVTPPADTVAPRAKLQFVAAGVDQFGEPMAAPATVTWSVAAGRGSINQGGTFTAPRVTGASTVVARSGGASGTAVVETVARRRPAPPSAAPGPVIGKPVTGEAVRPTIRAINHEGGRSGGRGAGANGRGVVTYRLTVPTAGEYTLSPRGGGQVRAAVGPTASGTFTTVDPDAPLRLDAGETFLQVALGRRPAGRAWWAAFDGVDLLAA